MNLLGAVFRELTGLFVDDGALALQIIAVVVLAAIAAVLVPVAHVAAGPVLVIGCLAVLIANVVRAARG
jgi:hypothetical protein